MDIQATCGCGAKISITPGSPSSLGNGSALISYNTNTVDAEREAVSATFKLWSEQHASCGTRQECVMAQPIPISFGASPTAGSSEGDAP